MENPGSCLHSSTVRTDIQNSVLEELSLFSLFLLLPSVLMAVSPESVFLQLLTSERYGLFFLLNLLIRPSNNYPLLHFFPHNSQRREEDAKNSSQMVNQMAPFPTINQDTALCWHLTAEGYSLVLETLLRFSDFFSSTWRWWILKSQPWLIGPINFRDRRGRGENLSLPHKRKDGAQGPYQLQGEPQGTTPSAPHSPVEKKVSTTEPGPGKKCPLNVYAHLWGFSMVLTHK